MLNKVILIGRLTRDPEIRHLQNGSPVASFSIAVDRQFKNKNGERETDFVPIVAWSQRAELCEKYLSKGSQCAISGRLQIRNYEDSNGNKRTIAEVVADDIEFLTSRSEAGSKPTYRQNDNFGIPVGDGFEEDPDDSDLPF